MERSPVGTDDQAAPGSGWGSLLYVGLRKQQVEIDIWSLLERFYIHIVNVSTVFRCLSYLVPARQAYILYCTYIKWHGNIINTCKGNSNVSFIFVWTIRRWCMLYKIKHNIDESFSFLPFFHPFKCFIFSSDKWCKDSTEKINWYLKTTLVILFWPLESYERP